jgi:nucleoside-diphosphate-sugar epimerase
MNVFIAGGCGYLGGAVTDLLLNTEHNVIVYDNLLYEENYRKNIPFVYGDIRDQHKLKHYLDWADVVIWLGAFVGDQACAINQSLAKEINTDSLNFLVDNFKKKIIFTSSASVYGLAEGILTEESPLNPQSHYAMTKIWAEEILKNSNVLIFRLGTLFGISDTYSRIRNDLILNILTMSAHTNNKLCIFGGNQWRPLIHVKDVAKTICENINFQKKGIYNLHKINITVLELAQLIKNYFKDLTLEITDTKFEDSRSYAISSLKAINILNFNPIITLENGILELKQLLEENRIKNCYSDRYSNYNYLKTIL